MATHWYKSGNYWYYAGSNGQLYKSALGEIDGKFYLFDSSGRMLTGFRQDNNRLGTGKKTYYFEEEGDNKGVMIRKDWKKVNDSWYYFNINGERIEKQFLEIDGHTYYFYPDGKMATGWKQNLETQSGFTGNDHIYYFVEAGAEALCEGHSNEQHKYTDKEIGWSMKYWTRWGNIAKDPFGNNIWYFFYGLPDPHMALGFAKLDDYWYYFASPGDEIYRIEPNDFRPLPNNIVPYDSCAYQLRNGTYHIDIHPQDSTKAAYKIGNNNAGQLNFSFTSDGHLCSGQYHLPDGNTYIFRSDGEIQAKIVPNQ